MGKGGEEVQEGPVFSLGKYRKTVNNFVCPGQRQGWISSVGMAGDLPNSFIGVSRNATLKAHQSLK